MKIALLGYGKMGKVIEQIALDRGHSISFKIDISNQADLDTINTGNMAVVIDFSAPSSAFENLKTCMKKGLKTVSGTTGWLDKRAEIDALCIEYNAAFFYASNYSIGVNLFFQLNNKLAKLMNGHNQYEVTSYE